MDVRELLRRARNTGVRAVLAVSVDHADWDTLRTIAPVPGVSVHLALGLHPYHVLEITLDSANDHLEELSFCVERAKLETPALRAIGECGLDFLRGGAADERARQVAVLRGHMDLARSTGLPLSLHCVKAHGAILELLRERPVPPSIFHAFSGSAEIARQLVDAGHYISFAANVCIPNARKVIAAARSVPAERLLIETDTPDQTPPAHRPADNEPAFIVEVARRLAELRRVPLEQLARETFANAQRVLRIAEGLPADPAVE